MVATPEAFVVAPPPLGNVALAPLAGAVKVTATLLSGWSKTGVRVNCLCPGRVETPWVAQMLTKYPDEAAARREMAATQAMGRMGTPTEVAAAALFLVSDEASYMTGVALPVDGGWTAGMFPRKA